MLGELGGATGTEGGLSQVSLRSNDYKYIYIYKSIYKDLFILRTPALSTDIPEEGIRPHYSTWLLGTEVQTSGRAVSALNH
jgi:hypothetical protein